MGSVLSNYSLTLRFHPGARVLLMLAGGFPAPRSVSHSHPARGCCLGAACPGGRRGRAGRSLPGAGLFLGKRKCWSPAEPGGGSGTGGWVRRGSRGGPGAGNAPALTQKQLNGAGGGGQRGGFPSALPPGAGHGRVWLSGFPGHSTAITQFRRRDTGATSALLSLFPFSPYPRSSQLPILIPPHSLLFPPVPSPGVP